MDERNRTENRGPRGDRDPQPRTVRVGDADREAMADVLRQHYAAGRLDAQEFEERIERCLMAKTFSDLDGLLDDLPPLQPPAPEPGPPPPDRGYVLPPWQPAYLIPVAIAFIALAVLTHGRLFWLFWPLFFLFLFGPWGRCGWRAR